MQNFNNKVIAITGASSGIGRALAIQCAKEGAHLALSDVNTEELNNTVKSCEAFKVQVHAQTLDVRDREEIENWAQTIVKHFGSVNVIVNNAGVNVNCCVEQLTYEDLEWQMDINFWGVVYGTKTFLPLIKNAGEGHIVNISSIFGIVGIPNQSAYNASKFAVRGFTESLRMELQMEGSPIGVTSIHPGGVKTNIVNDSRLGSTVGKQWSDEEAKKMFQKLAKTTPKSAAEQIIKGIKQNAPRVLIGTDAKVMDKTQRLLPTAYQNFVMKFFA